MVSEIFDGECEAMVDLTLDDFSFTGSMMVTLLVFDWQTDGHQHHLKLSSHYMGQVLSNEQ